MEKAVADFIAKYAEEKKQLEDFVDSGRYIQVLSDILESSTCINSEQVYEDNSPWTDDVDMLFRFIYLFRVNASATF